MSLWSNITSGPSAIGNNLSVIENPSSGTGQLFGIPAAVFCRLQRLRLRSKQLHA